MPTSLTLTLPPGADVTAPAREYGASVASRYRRMRDRSPGAGAVAPLAGTTSAAVAWAPEATDTSVRDEPAADPDRDLLEAARAGDRQAVDALILRYQVRMFNYARTLARHPADAEDVAQETFIRAFRSLGRFRGDSSFKNWLYRIATNVARSHFARRRRQAAVWDQRLEADEGVEDRLEGDGETPEAAVIHRQAIDRALATLTDDMRLPLVLHDVEGLEYREIARVLEIPIGTVMSRIFRARKKLRPQLAELRGRSASVRPDARGTDDARSGAKSPSEGGHKEWRYEL